MDQNSEAYVLAVLGRHQGQLLAAVQAAWRSWIGLMGNFPDAHPRLRRTVIQCLIVKEVRERFANVPGVRALDTADGRFLLVVERRRGIPDLVVQFKFLDDSYHTRNFRTPTAIAFDKQRPLPGLPKALRVTVGYRPDLAEVQLAGVFVVLAVARRIQWMYELTAATEKVTPLPMQPPLFGGKGRVRLKPEFDDAAKKRRANFQVLKGKGKGGAKPKGPTKRS